MHTADGARRRGGQYVLVAAGVAGVLTIAGCSSEAPAATADGEVTLEHVHGLAVDPADGELYAGTHHGLVRVSADGRLTRIADRVQDFMGFTVVGPEHYLASGHPGEGQSGPSNLGLIETTDGGETWTTLSLEGEADFHALDAARGVIYGYSGGRLLVSEDKTDWTDRGAASIADLAVDPSEPQRLLLTTEQGPALSEDGGETVTLIPGAPLLQLVAWAPDATVVVGVAPDGTVHASTDGGRTWEERGRIGGAPEALGVDGDNVYVAVGGAIVSSGDGGSSFRDLYRGD
ncbi:exo-alpha-sialidase [Blastococcus sp. CT_GayMR19]|uniref:F510_1955 family glycosylhydrolase n=1 Tax=Blastococcus sp. CT_GayMR19 TaxID=2559608 RepID=UPI0010745B6C|nr:exo-alpha-sialidase [Blastococcus sp. CT_GayMR19]TFV79384.1 exo-alpha-sialidase [Blastococcus sp. CT_GayMR19]